MKTEIQIAIGLTLLALTLPTKGDTINQTEKMIAAAIETAQEIRSVAEAGDQSTEEVKSKESTTDTKTEASIEETQKEQKIFRSFNSRQVL